MRSPVGDEGEVGSSNHPTIPIEPHSNYHDT